METYKRNQFLEAASATLGQGSNPTAALTTDAKRLLDTDRALERSRRSRDPERANYAFFSGEAPGRGVEVFFSPYEAFALRLGLDLLRHGWPQATAVKILRHVRLHLEPKHAEILRWNPVELFDKKKVLKAARPGDLATPTTRPVYLVIASSMGRGQRAANEIREVAVLENGELMPFLLREAGRSSTVIEITRLAHDLQSALAKTKPSKRGRAGA
jgi:hypothetical protein